MTKETAPYGSWPSPITADLIVAGTVSVSQVALDGDHVYWVEGRPAEKGCNVVVRRGPDGAIEDVTPADHNVRTRVHEYGGASYVVSEGTVYYSNFGDQRLYAQRPGEDSKPLTPDGIDLRYADAVVDMPGRRLIAVREDHSDLARTGEAVNEIVCVSTDPEMGAPEEVLVTGADFYSNPRLSPDGSRMSWLQWNHPNMPWDGCELWVAQVGDAGLTHAKKVAGGVDESIFQPEWSPDGVLHFVSDKSGWWNLYRLYDAGLTGPLFPIEAEFATPAWVFGMRTYGFSSAETIVCTYAERGSWTLTSLNTTSGELTPFDLPYTDFSSVRVGDGLAVFRAGSPTRGAEIVQLDLPSGEATVVSRPSSIDVDVANLSVPEAVEFPTEDGHSAHAFYYAPTNAEFTSTGDEKPPLLVKIHGGPTGATSSTLSLGIQYWTSRGFAVADVNYGGSTGYGTAYRRRLNDKWGIVDVDDCVNVARFLADRGDVDGDRLAIDGGSSGGFTALAVLTFRDVFHVGTSYYGVTDLEALARDTHKFESRYLDGLIAPYPEQAEVWRERSPIYNVDKLDRPVILFQGMEDKIVPPNQAETMVAAVREKGLPVAYVAYEGEQHGFRQAANIKRTLEGELYFYSRILGFELAEHIEPVPIENL
jgi:dipeptidyl aminopeptidase/acylaminoacyl peptidase